jgi:hypothetical protein
MRLSKLFYHPCQWTTATDCWLEGCPRPKANSTAWLQSYDETIGYVCREYTWYLTAFPLPPVRWLFNFHLYWEKKSDEKYGAPVSSMESYHRHNEYIRRMVPKDRLIEFEPS